MDDHDHPQCIVCLEDLGVVPDAIQLQDAGGVALVSTSKLPTPHPGNDDNEQLVALIKPCGHVLHDVCLREWSQKANSCPICRSGFNLVEVLDKVGGTTLSEYVVEDKKQVAEFDPNAWIEDNYEEEEEETSPCPICGDGDNEEVLLLCDSCGAPYHTYCVGLDDVPHDDWYCMECIDDQALRSLVHDTAERSHGQRRRPRTQASVRRTRRRARNDQWVGAWGDFSTRIHSATGLDLDFSDDEPNLSSYRRHQRRTADEQRAFQQWQQRLNIASRQGARDIFRRAAPVLRDPVPVVESQENLQAWSALERAQALDAEPQGGRKRKSRSVTASPAERSEVATEPERKLKRPRTRRVIDAPGPSSMADPATTSSRSINGTGRRASHSSRPLQEISGSEPSFLTQLLKEVETATSDDDTSRSIFPPILSAPGRVTSPSLDFSSPASSASSPSPSSSRPSSPLPLSSRIEPNYLPADYVACRSASHTPNPNRDLPNSPNLELRQPWPRRQHPIPHPCSQEHSPVRATMSAEAKDGINKIVKSALAPHWKAAEITKEQYADINRDISRKLYEVVADRTITDEKTRRTLEKMASVEIALAVKSLTT